MTMPGVGFAGLTHLGLVSAIGTASKGFRVIGYDADRGRVADINAGRLRVVEPDLEKMARTNAERLSYTDRSSDLGACDIVYIASDVPTDDRAQSDLSGVSALIGEVISA